MLPWEQPACRPTELRPAETIGEYVSNCQTDHRFAKLMGMTRVQLYRAKLMAELPVDLFEYLMNHDDFKPSSKALVASLPAVPLSEAAIWV